MRFLVTFITSLFLATAAHAAAVPTLDIDFGTCYETENNLNCGSSYEGPVVKFTQNNLGWAFGHYDLDHDADRIFKSVLSGNVKSGFTQSDQFTIDFSEFEGNFDIGLTLKSFGKHKTTTLFFSTLQMTSYILEWATIAQNLNWDGCRICSGPSYAISGISITPNLSVVPLPAAFPLYAAGMGIIGLMGWRYKRKTRP